MEVWCLLLAQTAGYPPSAQPCETPPTFSCLPELHFSVHGWADSQCQFEMLSIMQQCVWSRAGRSLMELTGYTTQNVCSFTAGVAKFCRQTSVRREMMFGYFQYCKA